MRSTFSDVSRSLKRRDLHVGVERLDRLLRRLGLRLAEPLGRVDDLALQVGRVDDVVVDDAERPDAGGGQVERGGGAEAARADQQHARVEELDLALLADLGDQQVAAVAAGACRCRASAAARSGSRSASSPCSRRRASRPSRSPARRASSPRRRNASRRRSRRRSVGRGREAPARPATRGNRAGCGRRRGCAPPATRAARGRRAGSAHRRPRAGRPPQARPASSISDLTCCRRSR